MISGLESKGVCGTYSAIYIYTVIISTKRNLSFHGRQGIHHVGFKQMVFCYQLKHRSVTVCHCHLLTHYYCHRFLHLDQGHCWQLIPQ